MYRCSRYYIYAQCTYTLVCITIKTQLIFQMKITSSRSLGGGHQMLHTYYREDAMGCSRCSSGYTVFRLLFHTLKKKAYNKYRYTRLFSHLASCRVITRFTVLCLWGFGFITSVTHRFTLFQHCFMLKSCISIWSF